MTFVNHGCNGDYNTDDMGLTNSPEFDEQTATIDNEPEPRKPFDPFTDRHIGIQKDIALRDIKAGEEITCSYLYFTGKDGWFPEVQELKKMCNGLDVGLITKSESETRTRTRRMTHHNETVSESSEEGCTTCDRDEL